MKYLLFHVLSLVAVATFVISILWSYGYIKDMPLFNLGSIKVRLRSLIDLSMILSRLALPLPLVPQLRLEPSLPLILSGSMVFTVGIAFILLSVKRLYPKLAYGREIGLVTNGVYSVVRHPMYFGDSIWPLGWSLIFGAICSSLLTPIWIIAYDITTRLEEEHLLRAYGEEYEEYRRRVRKLIPFIY